jgi:prevent-host-death family protein
MWRGQGVSTVNIHAAKTHLSRLVDKAAAGEEIVIARAGKPIARLVSLQAPQEKRQLGLLRGLVRVRDDFDAPLPDDLRALFEGRDEPDPA